MKEYPQPNSCGVYAPQETVKFREGRVFASVRIVQVGENDWRAGADAHLKKAGFGFAPSIHTMSFSSRDEAFFDGLRMIREFCMKQSDDSTTANMVIAWCRSFNQMRLL